MTGLLNGKEHFILEPHRAPAHYVKLVTDGGALETDEITEAFGDTLPPGLLV